MKLEDLRNPSPDIQKAYSPNFSNVENPQMMNEWIVPLLKFLARNIPGLMIPGAGEVIFDPIFGGEFDNTTADDDMLDVPDYWSNDPNYGDSINDGPEDDWDPFPDRPDWHVTPDDLFNPDWVDPIHFTPPPPPPTQPPTGPGSRPMHA